MTKHDISDMKINTGKKPHSCHVSYKCDNSYEKHHLTCLWEKVLDETLCDKVYDGMKIHTRERP